MIRILIPTDFSDAAQKAVAFAEFLYPHGVIEVFLLNVFEMVPASSEMIISIDDILKKNSNQGLDREKEKIEGSFPLLKGRVFTLSRFGSLVKSMEKFVKGKSIDLVLMGTKGAKGLDKLVFGSNASEVVRGLDIPVAVVPSKFEARNIKRVVLAINGYEKVQPKSLDILKSILGDHAIEILILTVVNEKQTGKSEENRAMVAQELKNFKFSCHTTHDEDISESINRFAINCNADLIALLPHKYPVVKKLFHHSVSRDLASRAKIPVLALR
jgi:nucleotide-binding universal stress UspA family protein